VNDLPPSDEYKNITMNISLCNRILVPDSGFSNISWFWFWLTIALLLLVNVVSLLFTIEFLWNRSIKTKDLPLMRYRKIGRRNRNSDMSLVLGPLGDVIT
jgi:uncharacterized membrane protein